MKENYEKTGITEPLSTPSVNNGEFKSLLQKASFQQVYPDRTLCYFDMFSVRKPECGPFRNGKFEFTIRGDARSGATPEKMIKYLLGIVKNYSHQYSLFLLRDNSKIGCGNDRIVFKMLHNKIEKNKLPNYADILSGFEMPEWLATEV